MGAREQLGEGMRAALCSRGVRGCLAASEAGRRSGGGGGDGDGDGDGGEEEQQQDKESGPAVALGRCMDLCRVRSPDPDLMPCE
jgi:hypothetical protein